MSLFTASNTDRSNVRVLRRLFAVAWRFRAQTIKVLGLQIVLLAMTLTGLSFTGLAIDIVRQSIDPHAPEARWPIGFVPPSDWGISMQLVVIGLSVLGAAVGASSLNYTYSVAVGRLVHIEMVATLRREIFAKLQRLQIRFFDEHASGSIVNRVTVDVQMLRSFVDGVVIQGTVLVLSLALFIAYLASVQPHLTVVGLSFSPLLFVATILFSRWAKPAYRESRTLADHLVRCMSEAIEGIQVIKAFGREREQYEQFQRHNEHVRAQQFKIFTNVSRFGPAVSLLNQLNVIVTLGYGAVLLVRGEVTLGQLIVFIGLLRQFSTRASAMADVINVLQQSLSGARRVFEILDAPVDSLPLQATAGNARGSDSAPVEYETTSDGLRTKGKITFENVMFGYNPERPVLSGVSLDVQPGECIGILGGTGSGKSSLLALLPRFYVPSQGRILIDERDLQEFELLELRKRIGYVFQESLLFHATVAGNIAYAEPGASFDRIERAARAARAHEFILGLPDGYDTMLEEGGTNLSGGQRQRIAIARALLCEPSILLLDDPTTAIDAATEAELLSAVDSAIRGRTTLLVSNRLSTLRRADRIVVLESGRIVQLGTHAELLAQPGLYRRTADLLHSTESPPLAAGLDR